MTNKYEHRCYKKPSRIIDHRTPTNNHGKSMNRICNTNYQLSTIYIIFIDMVTSYNTSNGNINFGGSISAIHVTVIKASEIYPRTFIVDIK